MTRDMPDVLGGDRTPGKLATAMAVAIVTKPIRATLNLIPSPLIRPVSLLSTPHRIFWTTLIVKLAARLARCLCSEIAYAPSRACAERSNCQKHSDFSCQDSCNHVSFLFDRTRCIGYGCHCIAAGAFAAGVLNPSLQYFATTGPPPNLKSRPSSTVE
jgi:hypothetical protein